MQNYECKIKHSLFFRLNPRLDKEKKDFKRVFFSLSWSLFSLVYFTTGAKFKLFKSLLKTITYKGQKIKKFRRFSTWDFMKKMQERSMTTGTRVTVAFR